MWSTVCDLIELSPSRKERRMNREEVKAISQSIAQYCYTLEGFDALKDAVWYNGLTDDIKKWADIPDNKRGQVNFDDIKPYDYTQVNKNADEAQKQILWMICVLLFGNYGTSPRFGWIEKVDEFKQFINDLTSNEEEE